MKKIFSLVLVNIVLVNPVISAEFMYLDGLRDYHCPQGLKCAAGAVTGVVLPGDADRIIEKISIFEEILKNYYEEPVVVNLIHLDSPGGDLLEAIKLGRYFRGKAIHTIVREESVCYSSCVMLYAAGVTKYSIGKIGIHTFFSAESFDIGSFSSQDSGYNEIAAIVREYLTEIRVSVNLLDMMYRVPPQDIRILDILELHDLGLQGEDPLFSTLRQ